MQSSKNYLVKCARDNYDVQHFQEAFRKYLLEISKIFDSFYLGIEISSQEDKKIAENIRTFAKEYGYSLVAFPNIKYFRLGKEKMISLCSEIGVTGEVIAPITPITLSRTIPAAQRSDNRS